MKCSISKKNLFEILTHWWGELRLLPAIANVASILILLLKMFKLSKLEFLNDIVKVFVELRIELRKKSEVFKSVTLDLFIDRSKSSSDFFLVDSSLFLYVH